MMKARYPSFSIALLGACALTVGVACASGLLTEVQTLESGGSSNPYSLETSVAGYGTSYGAFQQKVAALTDIGYLKNGSFTSASGVSSMSEYLQCSSCQIQAETLILKNDWSTLESNGTVSSYNGQTLDGITWNESALIECAQQLGATGCKRYLDTGVTTSNNPHLLADIAAASETDSSAITGTATTAVDNSSAITSDSQISAGTAAASLFSYCSKQVSALLSEMGRANVDKAALIAESGDTGFTMANGSGVVTSVTNNGASYTMNSDTGTGSFLKNSCLSNIFSNLLPSAIFQLPSLSTIMSEIESAACNAMNSEVSTLIEPVTSTLGEITSTVDGVESSALSSQVGGGGFMPGLSLAYLGFSGGTTSGTDNSTSSVVKVSGSGTGNFSLSFSPLNLLNGSTSLTNSVSSTSLPSASTIYSQLFN